MNKQFQYIPAEPITQNILLSKGLSKSNSAIFENFTHNLIFVINHEANLFWLVDQLGFEDANMRVKHITGQEIQPYKA